MTTRRPTKSKVTRNPLLWILISAVLVTAVWSIIILPRMSLPGDGPPFPAFAYVDFRDTGWLPTTDFLDGNVPWDISTYLARHPGAQEFLLYLPLYFPVMMLLVQLPYPVAAVIWLAVIAGALVILVWLGMRWANLDNELRFLPVASLAISILPVLNQGLRAGQLATVCALGAIVAITQPPRLASGGLALAMIKPPVGVPLLLALLVLKKFRVLAYGLAVATLMCAPFAVMTVSRLRGLHATGGVVSRSLNYAGQSPYGGTGAAHSTRVDVIGALGRIDMFLTPVGNAALIVMTIILAFLSVAITHRRFGPRHPAFLAAFAASMVAVAPNELYAYAVAIPAVVGATVGALTSTQRGWHAVLAGCLVVPFLHVHRISGQLHLTATEVLNFASISLASFVSLAWAMTVCRQEHADA